MYHRCETQQRYADVGRGTPCLWPSSSWQSSVRRGASLVTTERHLARTPLLVQRTERGVGGRCGSADGHCIPCHNHTVCCRWVSGGVARRMRMSPNICPPPAEEGKAAKDKSSRLCRRCMFCTTHRLPCLLRWLCLLPPRAHLLLLCCYASTARTFCPHLGLTDRQNLMQETQERRREAHAMCEVSK